MRESRRPHAPLGPQADPAASIELVMSFARAMHRAGTSSSELEAGVARLAAAVGVQAQLFATPTAIFASFGPAGRQRTALLRVEPGDVDLERLEDLLRLARAVEHRKLSRREALDALEALEARPERYAPTLHALAFGAVSASATVFVGGSLLDLLVSGIAGLGIGALAVLLSRGPELRLLFEPLAAGLVALLGVTMSRILPVNADVILVAGLIVLLPGLSLTQAIGELARRDLAAGSVRLAGAGTTFLTMGFGVALGRTLGARLPGAPVEPLSSDTPTLALWVALLVATCAFTVLFRAAPTDLPWLGLGAVSAFWAARFGADAFGPEIGAFLGAFAVGAGSHLLSRRRGHPPALTLLPGLILLVPGSTGLRSLAMFVDGAMLPGIDAAFDMMLLAVALVSGLLTAGVLVDPEPHPLLRSEGVEDRGRHSVRRHRGRPREAVHQQHHAHTMLGVDA